MDELYLDNIDEFVNDQDKIVTYKWLSLTLGVHVNTAKQMLFHYLDHKRKESSAQLHATYLVSGKFLDNGLASHKVSVVKEDQLEDLKSKMSLVVSVHVYSVQKALLKDSGPLYSVDYDAVRDNLKDCSRYSAIRCASAVPTSSPDRQLPPPEPENRKPAATSAASSTASTAASSTKPSTKPQKGIVGMFAASKAATKAPDGGAKEDTSPTVVKAAAKTKAALNFFGSQTAKKNDKVKPEEASSSSSSSSSAEKKPNVVVTATEPPKDAKKDQRSKSKRVESEEEEDEEAMTKGKKKRRRIKKPEPDSSDDDEVIPDSPPPMKETREPSPPPKNKRPENSEPKTRKRRRVLKSKTFVDEDGCIVTEKGYESESYSEAEDDFQAPKRAPKDSVLTKAKPEEKKKKTNANKNTKQASIMGFFQKK